jgi:hypothetical protein
MLQRHCGRTVVGVEGSETMQDGASYRIDWASKRQTRRQQQHHQPEQQAEQPLDEHRHKLQAVTCRLEFQDNSTAEKLDAILSHSLVCHIVRRSSDTALQSMALLTDCTAAIHTPHSHCDCWAALLWRLDSIGTEAVCSNAQRCCCGLCQLLLP